MYKLTKHIYKQKYTTHKTLLILFIVLTILNTLMNVNEPNRNNGDSYISSWTLIWVLFGMRSFYKLKIIKLELKLISLGPDSSGQNLRADEEAPQIILTDLKISKNNLVN